jgi:exodeoxyribonuclease VII large subunit
MSELVDDRKVFSLLEVTLSIQRTLADRYRKIFWVKAEMNKLNYYSHSGHCYPELVEKKDGRVIAQMKSNLWKNDFLRVNEKFMTLLKEPLKDGITILFSATVNFDPSHGLSLRILDIDPVFSLGELERERQETIRRLKEEGIFFLNKSLAIARLPKRIAVISVETSKGYADYLKIIEQNPFGYRFFNFLFPALLQGDRSVQSIIAQLHQVKKVRRYFDAVAIIRGGGGDVGLSSYNSYQLAREIALFPLPVFTGIGHSTNETVSEMVSFQNAITPTELAGFFIQRFHDFAIPLRDAQQSIVACADKMLAEKKQSLHNAARHFKSVSVNKLLRNKHAVLNVSTVLEQSVKFQIRNYTNVLAVEKESVKKVLQAFLKSRSFEVRNFSGLILHCCSGYLGLQNRSIDELDSKVAILDPANILRRGFSITLKDGRAVRNAADVSAGDSITTITAEGTIKSIVKEASHERTT